MAEYSSDNEQLIAQAGEMLGSIATLNGEYLAEKVVEYADSPRGAAILCSTLAFGSAANLAARIPDEFLSDDSVFSPQIIPTDDEMSDVEKRAAMLAGQTVVAVLNNDMKMAMAMIRTAIPNSPEPTDFCEEYVSSMVMFYRSTCGDDTIEVESMR